MTVSDPILEGLNEVQREIVTDCSGPMLVLAGAGSGKTRAVTHKMAWLLSRLHYLPYRVLAVTFTNKAAGEMRERIRKLVGPPAQGLELGTFHSVCARLLRKHADLLGHTSNFVIYDTDDAGVLMRQLVKDRGLDPKKFNPKRLSSTYDGLRAHNTGLENWVADAGWDRSWRLSAVDLFRAYEEAKTRLDAMDFTDLLHKMQRLLEEHEEVRNLYQERFEYVMVDEMQDTNHVQLELLKLLVGEHRRICAVGDDDQSIYGWRGARVENMLAFDKAFPGARIIRMEQNYRSTSTILDAAHAVIARNQRRHPKKLWTDNGEGDRLRLVTADTEGDEAAKVAARIRELTGKGVAPRDVAVFFRTNAQSRSFEEVFSREQIPHIVVGGMRFYERAEVKDALAYLRVIANPRDEVSLVRIINRPTRGIGDTGLQRLRERAYDRAQGLYEAALDLRNDQEPERWHKPIAAFVEQMERWRAALGKMSVSSLVMKVLEESTYLEKLQTLDSIEAESRLENLEQLVASISEQEDRNEELNLQQYLEQVALITDIDSWSEDREHVPLMTVHAAKGLEFDTVFITGMEEGLFPHQNHSDAWELEEERRLFYVAITRAQRRVELSCARLRYRFGETESMRPSRFLVELGSEHLDEAPVRRRGSFSDAMARRQSAPVVRRRAASQPVAVRQADAGPRWSGQRVAHPKHGEGKVLAAVGEQLVVKFDSGKLVTVKSDAVTMIP